MLESINKESKQMKERVCLKGLKVKEEEGEIYVSGYVATTHPDRVGDILSEKAIDQIVEYINTDNVAGGQNGAYRSVSLFHDWIKQSDPTLDEVAFLKPNAEKVKLDDGHYAVQVESKLNKFYHGSMPIEEVKYRIDNGQIAGFSIEYDTDDSHSKNVNYQGESYRYIDSLTEFGGVGLARARMIANPHAVIFKEIVDKVNNPEAKMTEEKNQVPEMKEQEKEMTPEQKKKKEEDDMKAEEEKKKKAETKEVEQPKKELDMKEIISQVVDIASKELEVKSKILKQTKESENKMETKEIPLSIKEMKESIASGKMNLMQFKEAASQYFAENPKLDMQLKTTGIALNPTMQVKCAGNKLRIVGGLQYKTTLDTTTNAGAYTESAVEFADLFIPGLIETFNNQANLFGALRKVDHLMGGQYYGWKLKTDQAGSLAVDSDDPTVVKNPVDKIKLRTEIKEYRVGVSVTDYVAYHARATMGDMLMLEAEARMGDLMRDVNDDLFAEVVDTTGNAILGLEAVADSAGNTSLYGKTRSTANRLAPDAAADTYVAVAGALTTAILRNGITKVEIEGARRENIRIVTNPAIRDDLFELEDGNQNYFNAPKFGFDGQISYDGVPVIVDSSCQSDSLYVVDFESEYIVVSKAPQLVGLAKVGAAEEAYISMYIAHVYEQPRRIHMLNTLS